jgi:hypothetical protein
LLFLSVDLMANEFTHPPQMVTHIATALPALPRNPKPEDARLLYRYMAEGIYPKGARLGGIQISSGELVERCLDEEHSKNIGLEITGAIDSKTGERVEIAIKD